MWLEVFVTNWAIINLIIISMLFKNMSCYVSENILKLTKWTMSKFLSSLSSWITKSICYYNKSINLLPQCSVIILIVSCHYFFKGFRFHTFHCSPLSKLFNCLDYILLALSMIQMFIRDFHLIWNQFFKFFRDGIYYLS